MILVLLAACYQLLHQLGHGDVSSTDIQLQVLLPFLEAIKCHFCHAKCLSFFFSSPWRQQ